MKTPVLKIGKRIIGEGYPTFIVADIGLNHNGSIKTARELIRTAKECGADGVKFQKRNLRELYKSDIYKDPNMDSQATAYLFDIYRKFELSASDYRKLKQFAENLGLVFFATPFDRSSAQHLTKLDIPMIKVASADVTNLPLIEDIASSGKPVILSTGMSEFDEIDMAVKILRKHHANFALLHCVSAYPTNFKDVNLRLIPKLYDRYKVPVGYSGHERGITVSVCAVTLGAAIIEKHFTLDRSMYGPDHNISLTPEGLKKLVDRIRVAELALGDGEKHIVRGEILTRETLSKSLVAARMIRRGAVISKDMIEVKGPGKGLNPRHMAKIIGKITKRDIPKADYFTLSDL